MSSFIIEASGCVYPGNICAILEHSVDIFNAGSHKALDVRAFLQESRLFPIVTIPASLALVEIIRDKRPAAIY